MSLLARLPDGPPSAALALALNTATALGLVSRQALEPLIGRTILLEASDLGARVRLAYSSGGFRACPIAGCPDLTIRASVRDYFALALRREDPDTLFFTRRLVMTGDTELGLVVKNALDAIDWDRWQEKLPPGAALLGRVFARRDLAGDPDRTGLRAQGRPPKRFC